MSILLAFSESLPSCHIQKSMPNSIAEAHLGEKYVSYVAGRKKEIAKPPGTPPQGAPAAFL